MTDPVSCPFCGSHWVRRDSGFIHGKVERENHFDQFCPLQGSFFTLDQLARLYSMLPVNFYQVIDGYPVFNMQGIGHRATTEDLNKFMEYFKEKLSDR